MTAQPHCARVNGGCNRCDTPVPFAFTMAFQPIVDVTQRQVVYYEALVRGIIAVQQGYYFARPEVGKLPTVVLEKYD